MKVGLVLGGGGTVGMAFHAGVLAGLADAAGFEADECDLIVGTSAGSIVGAHVRSGWSAEDFYGFAQDKPPTWLDVGPDEIADLRSEVLAPAFKNPLDALRRLLGSSYIISRSLVRIPAPRVPAAMAGAFPGGLLRMDAAQRFFEKSLPRHWPDRDLYIVSIDTNSGRRIVFGRAGAPDIDLHTAVRSSCAVPGVFPPVRHGKRVLVDGGVESTTNLDLAVTAGCDLIVVVAPMGVDHADRPSLCSQVLRRIPSGRLDREIDDARRRGVDVLRFTPTADEVKLHGINFLRRDRWQEIAAAAREATARSAESRRLRHKLALDG
jgi:NTE family protein